MSTEGLEFLESWINNNVTGKVKLTGDDDAALVAVKLGDRAIADAAQRGLSLNDLEPEFLTAALKRSEFFTQHVRFRPHPRLRETYNFIIDQHYMIRISRNSFVEDPNTGFKINNN